MRFRHRGFTLIEVMVALAVFAVVSVTLVRNATLSLRQAGLIEDRTTAWWIAENQMTRLRLQQRTDENFPGAGVDRESLEINGVEWEVEVHVETTENDFVRRVNVVVYKGLVDEPSATLTGFLGRY